jgi:hypothetical protein
MMNEEDKAKYGFYFYKWICEKTNNGKPWTWTVRDFTKQWPLVIILCAVSLGVWLGVKLKPHLIYIIPSLLIGILLGHFYW